MSFVYFIQAEGGGPIKIGRAVNVARRLGALQGGNVKKLVVLAFAPGGDPEERALHRRFSVARVAKTEWFSPSQGLLAVIETVSKTGVLPDCEILQFPTVSNIGADFLAEVDQFLFASGMSPTAFGRAATSDGNFHLDLRRGRAPNLRTIEKARAFMRDHRKVA